MTAHVYDTTIPRYNAVQPLCSCGWVGETTSGDGKAARAFHQWRTHFNEETD